jgi:glycine/D-amino acid oxidase-like deaminating enzyme/nitrite reductase/ring-hydroxylating ferredoxin subunit
VHTEKSSVWIETHPGRTHPQLAGDLQVDVAIVGGGFTGLTTAVLLGKMGVRVAVVEAHRIAHGDSGMTTSHLTVALDSRYKDLLSKFGENDAREVAESQRAALEQIAALVAEHNIECDLKRVPAYLYAEHPDDRSIIEEEFEAALKVGLSCALINDVPLPFRTECGLRFEDQAQLHPLKYLHGLAELIGQYGGYIFENTRVTEINEGDPPSLVTENGTITARSIVVATHTPVNTKVRIHTKIAGYRTYVLGIRSDTIVPEGLFFDTADPYNYIRNHPTANGDLLIVGGADHKVGQKQDTRVPFGVMERYAREHFGQHTVDYMWSGQVFETIDGLPYIGKLTDRSYVATGFAGNGTTHGTLAAMLIRDSIAGRENAWSKIYDPTRMKPLASVKRFVVENVDFPAHLVADRLKSDADTIAEVGMGEGKIVDHRGKKLAVYRDDQGLITVRSAVCTHLGCIVQFNHAEKSWDCPCHGARYNTEGEVLEGPAVKPLAKVLATEELEGDRSKKKLG